MEPRWASLSAGEFWQRKNLNPSADIGDFERITRRINGGTNGMEDRLRRWAIAKKVLA
jgi:putative chitinase